MLVLFKKFFILLLVSSFTLQNANAFDLKFFSKDESNREYIYIVGSSTISPLVAAISEEFSRKKSANSKQITTPVVESSGTKEGFRLFCQGVGKEYPDFVNASRPILPSELEECRKNGVSKPIAIKIGYDGIVIGNFVGNKKLNLTKKQIYQAIAQKIYDEKTQKLIPNPYKKWNQIAKNLPNVDILIYGPPKTSGTRDLFIDMLMSDICVSDPNFIKLYPNEENRKKECFKIRTDSHFIDSGENDNLIVKQLKNNKGAFGILGFNFLAVNRNIIQAVKIDGVNPSFSTISSKKYQLSRPLFIYLKREHLNLIDEIKEFTADIIDKKTIGKKGYLVHSGLVPLTNIELNKVRKKLLSEIK